MIPTIFKRLPLLAVAAFSILLLCACAAKSTGSRQTRQHQIRPSFDSYGATFLDVTYCTMDGQPQKMDVYLPQSGGPWPVLVYVHGGSWMSGDKSESRGLVNDMTAQGYAIVSLNYRLYPSIRFPRMIEDVKCAIRSLRAHVRDFHLDGKRIAAIGMSAGGHLVSLLGTSDQSAGWDVGEYLGQSSRVQAVIALAPATDLTQQFLAPGQQSQLFDGFGEVNLPAASPIMHITTEDPPFLLIHGQLDPLLPVQQSQSMYERLIAAGVTAQLVIVQNGDHGLTAVDGSARPTMDQIKQIMLDFLAAHL